jgi:hypothetical protein
MELNSLSIHFAARATVFASLFLKRPHIMPMEISGASLPNRSLLSNFTPLGDSLKIGSPRSATNALLEATEESWSLPPCNTKGNYHRRQSELARTLLWPRPCMHQLAHTHVQRRVSALTRAQ